MDPHCIHPDDDLDAAHRLGLGLAGGAAALAGLACLLWPVPAVAWALPWPVPPLHARCLGAIQLAAGLCWLACVRERDAAAVRIPLAGLAAAAMALLLAAALGPSGAAPAWPALGALLAGAGTASLWRLREVGAPAQRPQPAWVVLSCAAALAAAGLAFAPRAIARGWPWPLPEAAAAQYACALGGAATALWQLARERRRAGRRLALRSLRWAAAGVAAVSLLHLESFHGAAAAAAWIGGNALLAVVAAERRWPRRLAAGHRPHPLPPPGPDPRAAGPPSS